MRRLGAGPNLAGARPSIVEGGGSEVAGEGRERGQDHHYRVGGGGQTGPPRPIIPDRNERPKSSGVRASNISTRTVSTHVEVIKSGRPCSDGPNDGSEWPGPRLRTYRFDSRRGLAGGGSPDAVPEPDRGRRRRVGCSLDQEARPDLLVLHLMLPRRSGFDDLRALRSAGSAVQVILITARDDAIDNWRLSRPREFGRADAEFVAQFSSSELYVVRSRGGVPNSRRVASSSCSALLRCSSSRGALSSSSARWIFRSA